LELERVILRALAKDPQERYQTAQELVADLGDLVYQLESTAPTGVFKRPPHREASNPVASRALAERLKALTRQSPLLWVGLAATILLVVAVGLFFAGVVTSATPTGAPDATGTALAGRLAALEETLAVTPTPSHTPSASPRTSTQTALPLEATTSVPSLLPSPTRVEATVVVPSPSPTRVKATAVVPSPSPTRVEPTAVVSSPSPSPIACVPSMSVLQDVNYYNTNWWSTVDARFNKTWKLENGGDCPWPEGTVLVHLDGDSLGLDRGLDVVPLAAGEVIDLSIPLQAPAAAGEYEGRFQLQTRDGEPIGELLTVKLEARPRNSPTPTASGGLYEPVRITAWDLIEWYEDPVTKVWRGKVRMRAGGGNGQYVWYRDTLDYPLPGDIFEFEWRMCGDFYGSVWVSSAGTVDNLQLHIPYPKACE
jgi:hypothetical protein